MLEPQSEYTSDICEMWIVTEAYAYFIHAYIFSLNPQTYVWFMRVFEISIWDFHLFNGNPNANVRIIPQNKFTNTIVWWQISFLSMNQVF